MPYHTLTVTLACLLTASEALEPRTIAVANEPAGRTSRQSAPLDACAVLTRADVAEVVGEEPRVPKAAEPSPQLPGSEMVGSVCQYRGEGWRIRFFVEQGHSKESKEIARTTFKGWQRVPGLGEEAYWGQSDPNKPGTLTAFNGPHAVVINWFVSGDTPGPGTLEKSRELVRRALGRL
jgi:hypothetical protein